MLYLASLFPVRVFCRLGHTLACAAFLCAAFLNASLAFAQAPETTFRLAASERTINEGDVVQFMITDKTYWDASGAPMKFEADLSPVEWDFGDGRQDPAGAFGLYDMKHWFAKDRVEPYVVSATHQGNTEQVRIQVNDVLPVIHSIAVTEAPKAGAPVVFQAAVRDPGFDDAISFTWDFGQGATATGPNAVHSWDSVGIREVTLSVKDENRDDPPRTFTFPVTIDDGRYYEDNTFSVFGDFSSTNAEIDGLTLVGTTANVTDPDAQGPCQVRIDMRTMESDMGVILTANLGPGLVPGVYSIGQTREYDGMHAQDAESPGMFFAEFVAPQEEQYRNIGGLKIGGPFWSDQGTVIVRKFEGGELELDFNAVFTEQNVPASRTEPREVAVWGALVTDVPNALSPSDVADDPSQAANIPGLDILARSVLSTGQELSGGERNTANVKHYACKGEEPGGFEVAAATPGSNEVSAPYEDAVVAVEFSRSVDPDSVVDPDTLQENLLLAIRADNGYRGIPGNWMPSKDNPRVVQFIPQSRLVPGAIHCVYVAGGEKGIRSFTGALLEGSSLDAHGNREAQACSSLDGYLVSHAFSTRVEMESVGVALYQRSLLGPHAPLVPFGGNMPAVARVYPWWQDAIGGIHTSAEVKTFDARVFAMANRQRMTPLLESGGYVETQIRRPDLYSSEERRIRMHSIDFSFSPDDGLGTFDYFAAVQPLNARGAPVEPVDPSQIRQMGTKSGLDLDFGYLQLNAVCEAGLSPQDCDEDFWEAEGSFARSGIFSNSVIFDLPVSGSDSTSLTETFNITQACPGGVINGVCFESLQALSESEDGLKRWRHEMAKQIVNNTSIFERPDFLGDTSPDFDILLVALPPRMISSNQVDVYTKRDWGTNIIFFQSSVNPVVSRKAIVDALLEGEACDFSGDSACDVTPVQGFFMNLRGGQGGNLHHAEGNEFGGPLIPLMKDVDPQELPVTSYVISAYNYARLYEALERLNND